MTYYKKTRHWAKKTSVHLRLRGSPERKKSASGLDIRTSDNGPGIPDDEKT